jgi:hypothetical protein
MHSDMGSNCQRANLQLRGGNGDKVHLLCKHDENGSWVGNALAMIIKASCGFRS